MTMSSSLPDLTGDPLLLRKKIDALELGFYPSSGAFVCVSRINPACVVKPAHDAA
jgi:hypothetical protein